MNGLTRCSWLRRGVFIPETVRRTGFRLKIYALRLTPHLTSLQNGMKSSESNQTHGFRLLQGRHTQERL